MNSLNDFFNKELLLETIKGCEGWLAVNRFYIKIYCFIQKSVNIYLHFLFFVI